MSEQKQPSVEEIARIVKQVIERELGSRRTDESSPKSAPKNSPTVLITYEMVKDCHKLEKNLVLPPKYIMTPLAKDAIDQFNVKVIQSDDTEKRSPEKLKSSLDKLVIWSDRFSHDFKNRLVESLTGGFTVYDYSSDDSLANFVKAIQNNSSTRGIAISATGAELSVLLNKYPGIRAVFSETVEPVTAARERVSANALVLSSQQTSLHNANMMAQRFIHTEFLNPRYKELIEEILNAERGMNQQNK